MRLSLLLGCVLLLTACDDQGLYACTDDFRAVAVEVVDGAGRPVEGLTAESVNERTGEALSAETLADGARGSAGAYVVASDADLDALHVDGDPVRFTASGEGVIATARFILADDGCHVSKEEGPDQITARAL